jgi:hypothetical protein
MCTLLWVWQKIWADPLLRMSGNNFWYCTLKVYVRVKLWFKVGGIYWDQMLMLPLGGLRVKHAVQRGIWAPTHRNPWSSWPVAGPSGCKLMYINSIRISQETHYVSATKPNRLMLFTETVAVYCENHAEHTNTLCEQKTQSVPQRKHITSPLQSPTG